MKRNVCMLALAGLMTLALAACGGEEPAPQAQAGQEAVGAIFVPGGADLPEGKVYAQFADREYTFALDAAWVYYFDTVEGTEPVAYAGDGNLTQLTFGADIDGGGVGALGAGVFRPGEENDVAAYYLRRDEAGVYFAPAQPFDTATLTEEHTFLGTDYPCQVTFTPGQPAASCTLSCLDEGRTVIAEETLDPAAVEDFQTFTLAGDTASVVLTAYDGAGGELGTQEVTPENPSAVVCCDAGGQMLASKVLRFAWPEE